MATKEERIYVIPLRLAYEKPRKKRARKAIKIIKSFVKKHMKVEEVKLSPALNDEIWKRGIEKPPRKVEVKVVKEENIAFAMLKQEKKEEAFKKVVKEEAKEEEKEKEEKKEVKKEEKKEKVVEEKEENKKKEEKEEKKEEEGKEKK